MRFSSQLLCMLFLFANGLAPCKVMADTAGVALWKHGEALAWNSRYLEALHEFDAAIKTNPKTAEAYNGRAQVFNVLGDFASGLDNCNKCIALDDKYAPAYANRSTSLYWLGQYKRALADAKTYEQLQKKTGQRPSFGTNITMAAALEGIGQLSDALSYCNKAISLSASVSNSYAIRARIEIKQRAYKQAITDCNKAIIIFQRSPRVYESRALAYEKLGDKMLASRDRKIASQINRENLALINQYRTQAK